MNEIAKRIYLLMDEREISYGDLARETGIPKSALQRYVTGETEKIPLDRIKSIAKALGVDATVLIGWHSEAHAESEATGALTVTRGPALDDEANEIMREMYERPELKALFKTSKKVSADDIRMVDKLLKHMAGEDDE